jgi:hypothetical protein
VKGEAGNTKPLPCFASFLSTTTGIATNTVGCEVVGKRRGEADRSTQKRGDSSISNAIQFFQVGFVDPRKAAHRGEKRIDAIETYTAGDCSHEGARYGTPITLATVAPMTTNA